MVDWGPGWFDRVYLRNYDRLKGSILRVFADEMLAEELVQETFLILLSRQHELKKRRHPNIDGWLTVTARNLVKNELGRANYRNECPLDDETVAVTLDCYKSLEDALPGSLSPVDRQILLWYYEDRLNTVEIARCLNAPESTVRVRIFRARKKLEKFFEKRKKDETKLASEYIYK